MKVEKLIRKNDDPVLKMICEPVAPGENIAELIDTLTLVVRKHRDPRAAGLAAPQIGVAKRVIVTNVKDALGIIRVRVMINPVITRRSPSTEVAVEGCLSYPGISKRIRRHTAIDVQFENVNRHVVNESLFGFPARVVQHEVDHLDGICRVGDDSPEDVSQAEERERHERFRSAARQVGIHVPELLR